VNERLKRSTKEGDMPRYVIQRKLGEVSDAQLQEAAVHSKRVREERFPDIGWDHSHVVRTPSGLMTFCIYDARSPERIQEHARAAGLPADVIYEVAAEVDPAAL
jgi:ribosomal protein L32E